MAEASGQLYLFLTASSINIGRVTTKFPPIITGVRYTPIDKIKTSVQPAMIPGRLKGRVTLKKILKGLAPKLAAASSNELFIELNAANKGKTIKER